MSDITITNTAGVDAAVNAPAVITLYTNSGTPVEVPANKADELLLIGFRLNRLTLPDAAQSLAEALTAAAAAARALTDEIAAAGIYDPNAGGYPAAFLAMRAIEHAWADFRLAVEQHPAKEQG